MKKVKIHFLYETNGLSSIPLLSDLEPEICFVLDEENPDYVFVKEYIFTDRKQLSALKDYKEKGCICIFFAGECISPDFNIFDYALVFDDGLQMDDRCVRVPTTVFFADCLPNSKFDILPNQNPKKILEKKTGFCNFIYSNANAHPNRDKLFYKISEYKHIESLGRHLKNKDIPDTRENKDWPTLSIELKKPYKFSIASENACFKGYTSEKLLTSFQANTVPIYWGNPNVSRDFNPKSFINCNDYSNFSEVLEKVKEIDNNDNLWCEMISQPRQTREQISLFEKEKKEYLCFLKHIFLQDKESARRAPVGCWTNNYCRWFFASLKEQKPVLTESKSSQFKKLKYKILYKLTYGKVRKKYKEKYKKLKTIRNFFIEKPAG